MDARAPVRHRDPMPTATRSRRLVTVPDVPTRGGLRALRESAATCRACPLWKDTTQTVFGEGPTRAPLMMIGEQPGDHEDREGHVFVGPAGRVLDRALEAVGIDRGEIYLTNVVKHFKHENRGTRRIHQKPDAAEIDACRPWLDAEIARVKPTVLVCLGATAAQALLGRSFRVTKQRGVPIESELADYVVATVHPSSILRAPDSASRAREMKAFVKDLRRVAAWMA